MKKDRAEIDRELDAIAAWVPVMLAETDEGIMAFLEKRKPVWSD